MASGATTRSPRSAGLLHAAILVVLVVVIAAVALVAKPPSPPTVAEFAPKAIQQIKQAPNNQSSQFGTGGSGDCGGSLICDSTTTTTATTLGGGVGGKDAVEVARVKRCVGNPPRQIEDPQSPPCVAYWKGNNGGATTKGVTGTEITIAYPNTTGFSDHAAEQDLVRFFNSRFQLYGRQIILKPYGVAGSYISGGMDPTSMNSDAVKVDEEQHAFASLAYFDKIGTTGPYYDELARRKIIGVENVVFTTEAANYDRSSVEGYEWGYLPSLDKLEANLADWSCKGLVGHPADHAGPPFAGPAGPAKRSFGVLLQAANGQVADGSAVIDRLKRCGAAPDVIQVTAFDDVSSQNAIAKLASNGDTSVVCICNNQVLFSVSDNASKTGYQPEWLMLGGAYQDEADSITIYMKPDQSRHLFGMWGDDKLLRDTDSPWYWAIQETDPAQISNVTGAAYIYAPVYHQLLLLASGIQMAGPNLTPATFREALMKTEFPNPVAGAAPYFQARVGFGPSNHTMIQDEAAVWFDPNQPAPSGSTPGRFCYVQLGRRWSVGSWPAIDGTNFFPGATPPTVPCV